MHRVIAVIVAALGLSGCWPALKVVQPRAEIEVTDASGEPLEGASVTFVRANVFPNWHLVLGELVTDAGGTVKLPLRLKWHMQIMLPDAVASYSWAYCVEKDGYGALVAPLERWQRPTAAVLNRSAPGSMCVPPNEDYPYLRVLDRSAPAPSQTARGPRVNGSGWWFDAQ